MGKFNSKVYPTVYIRQTVLNSLQAPLKVLQDKTGTSIVYNETEGYFDITGRDQQGCDNAENRLIKGLLPRLDQQYIDERNLKGTYKSLDIIRDEDLIGAPVIDEPELETVKISGQPARLDHDDIDDDECKTDDDDSDGSGNEMYVETFNFSNNVRSIKALLASPLQQNMQGGDYLKLVGKATGTECVLKNKSIQITGCDISLVRDALERFSVIETTYLGFSKRMVVPCINYPQEYDKSGLYFCSIPHYKRHSYVNDNFFPEDDISGLYIILPVFLDEKTSQYDPPKDLILRKKQQQIQQQCTSEQMLNRAMQAVALNNGLGGARPEVTKQQQARPISSGATIIPSHPSSSSSSPSNMMPPNHARPVQPSPIPLQQPSPQQQQQQHRNPPPTQVHHQQPPPQQHRNHPPPTQVHYQQPPPSQKQHQQPHPHQYQQPIPPPSQQQYHQSPPPMQPPMQPPQQQQKQLPYDHTQSSQHHNHHYNPSSQVSLPTPSQRQSSTPIIDRVNTGALPTHQRHHTTPAPSSHHNNRHMLASATSVPMSSKSNGHDYSSRPSSSQSSLGPPLSMTSPYPSDTDSVNTLDEFQPPLWGSTRSFVNVYNSGISPVLSDEILIDSRDLMQPTVSDIGNLLKDFPELPKAHEIPKYRKTPSVSSVRSARSDRSIRNEQQQKRVMRIVNQRSSNGGDTAVASNKSNREMVEEYNFNNIKIALNEGLEAVRGFKGEVKLSAKLGKILWSDVNPVISKRIWDYTDIKDVIVGGYGAIPHFGTSSMVDDDMMNYISDILPNEYSATSIYEFHCSARNQPQVDYKDTVLYVNEGAIALTKVSISERNLTEVNCISLDRDMDYQLALTVKELVRCDVKPYTTFIKWISVCPNTRQMTFEEVPDFLYVREVFHRRTSRYKSLFPYIIEITRVERVPLKQVKTTQYTKAKKLQCQAGSGEAWYDIELSHPAHNLRFKSNLDLEVGKTASWQIEDILGEEHSSANMRDLLKAIRHLVEKTEEAFRSGS